MLNELETYERLETMLNILGYELDNPEESLIGSINITKNGKPCGKITRTTEYDLDGYRTTLKDELLEINCFNTMLDYGIDQDEKFVELVTEKFTLRNYVFGIDLYVNGSKKEYYSVFTDGEAISYCEKDSFDDIIVDLEQLDDELSDIEDEVYHLTGFDIITAALNYYKNRPKKEKKSLILEP